MVVESRRRKRRGESEGQGSGTTDPRLGSESCVLRLCALWARAGIFSRLRNENRRVSLGLLRWRGSESAYSFESLNCESTCTDHPQSVHVYCIGAGDKTPARVERTA